MLSLRFVNISAGQITSSQLASQHSSFVFPFLDGFLNIPVGQEVKFLQLIAGGGGGGAGAGIMGMQHSSFVFPLTLEKGNPTLSIPAGHLKSAHDFSQPWLASVGNWVGLYRT